MAKQAKRRTARTVKKEYVSPFKIYWDKKNYLFFSIGFILLIIGFFVMTIGEWDSASSLYLSPIILFLAYFFLFPASIFYRKKSVNSALEETEVDSSKS